MYQNLKLGDINNDVVILQEKLKVLGFYNAIITGSFGKATEEGVKAFQSDRNLEVTGVVNQETWNILIRDTEQAINPYSTFPNLSLGSTGSYVKDLQTKLKALLFYNGEINGNFDLETEISVKRFQLNNELTASGIVNNQTWTLLNSLYGNLNSCVLDNDVNDTEGYFTYTVKKDDTLYSIARMYDTTVSAIKSLNNLTSDILQIGQILKIPSSSTTSNNYFEYTVVMGDSLYSLAQRYNTTIATIKSLNNLTSDVLQIGQVLKIPSSNTSNNDYFNYIVVKGDSLYSLAQRYNTTVSSIKNLNDLTSDILQIGQVLKIPINSNGIDYITYTVQKNDTLYGIALLYNTTVAAIKSLNELTSDTLQIGQILKIPV